MAPLAIVCAALVWSATVMMTATQASPLPAHPRLIFTDSRLAAVDKAVKSDPVAASYLAREMDAAVALLSEPPLARPASSYSGILTTVRAVLARLYTLTLVARVTGNETFAARAVKELKNCTKWSDWNPGPHFLDTAEMMHGVAAALDGLWDSIEESDREEIADGLVTNGLDAFVKYSPSGWWHETVFNWGGVCNGGAIVGALALLDDVTHGATAAKVLGSALQGIPHAISSYAPSGLWPEGPIYEEYQTRYVIPAIVSLEGSGMASNASGLVDASGGGLEITCLSTLYQMGAGTKEFFSYSDSDPGPSEHPNLLFLGQRFNQPACAYLGRFQAAVSLAAAEGQTGAGLTSNVNAGARNLLYYTPLGTAEDVSRLPLDRVFNSTVLGGDHDPASGNIAIVATFHRSWNLSNVGHEDNGYLAVRGSVNGINHGHLDAGSFVYDYSGARFAEDLGSGWYGLPDYFGGKRWTYLRTNSTGHNVLAVGDPPRNQDVPSISQLTSWAVNGAPTASHGPWAVADVSAAYKSSGLTQALRGFAYPGREAALIVDNLRAAPEGAAQAPLTWRMWTPARNVSVDPSGKFFVLRDQFGESGRVVEVSVRVLPSSTECPGLTLLPPTTPTPAPPQRPLDGHTLLRFRAPDASKCGTLAITIGPSSTEEWDVNTDVSTWSSSGPIKS